MVGEWINLGIVCQELFQKKGAAFGSDHGMCGYSLYCMLGAPATNVSIIEPELPIKCAEYGILIRWVAKWERPKEGTASITWSIDFG